MGEDFKRDRREAFKQRQDRSFREIRIPDLFSARPDLFARTFRCTASTDSQVAVGASFDVFAAKNEIRVVAAAELVGVVDDPNAIELLRALEAELTGGAEVVVTDSSPLGSFSIRLMAPESDHDDD